MGLISKKQASSKSIFIHLCDQMDKLNSNVITVDEAKAQGITKKVFRRSRI